MRDWISIKPMTFFRMVIFALLLYIIYYVVFFVPLQEGWSALEGRCVLHYKITTSGERSTTIAKVAIDTPAYFVPFATQRVRVHINKQQGETATILVYLYGQSIVACSDPTSGIHCTESYNGITFRLPEKESSAVGVWNVTSMGNGYSYASDNEGKESDAHKNQFFNLVAMGKKGGGEEVYNVVENVVEKEENTCLNQSKVASEAKEYFQITLAMLLDMILLPPWSNVFLLALAFVIAHAWEQREEEQRALWEEAVRVVEKLREEDVVGQPESREEDVWKPIQDALQAISQEVKMQRQLETSLVESQQEQVGVLRNLLKEIEAVQHTQADLRVGLDEWRLETGDWKKETTRFMEEFPSHLMKFLIRLLGECRKQGKAVKRSQGTDRWQ